MPSASERQKIGSRHQPSELGRAIRHRRKALGKTLVEVAGDASLTTGFISQVERGISSPSLSSLLAIAASLQISIEQLMSMPEEFNEFVAKDRRQAYTIGNGGRHYERLGPGFAGALLHPSIIYRPAGHESERMCHPGEVFCYLIAGQVEYHLGDAVYILSAGDTIHHDTSKPHFSRVLGETGSTELWVGTRPANRQ